MIDKLSEIIDINTNILTRLFYLILAIDLLSIFSMYIFLLEKDLQPSLHMYDPFSDFLNNNILTILIISILIMSILYVIDKLYQRYTDKITEIITPMISIIINLLKNEGLKRLVSIFKGIKFPSILIRKIMQSNTRFINKNNAFMLKKMYKGFIALYIIIMTLVIISSGNIEHKRSYCRNLGK